MPAFATVEALKRHLNKTTSADDGELQDMLDAATEVVQSLIGTAFDAETVTERVRVLGDGTALLSRRPVAGGVVLNGGDITGHGVDSAAGLLYDVRSGWAYPVTATYSVAAQVVPASVMLATLIIAAHLYETQRMPGQSMDSRPAGFGGADGIADATPFSGFAIPNRAQELLDPWIRKAIVG